MNTAPASLSLSPETRFRFVGGDTSVDFVNTVVWTDAGPINERLADYAALLLWIEGAQLLDARRLRELRRLAKASPTRAAGIYDQARELRWTLRKVLLGVIEGRVLDGSLEELNGYLLRANAHRRLRPDRGPTIHWDWQTDDDPLALPLWPVALAAAALLTSADAARLRLCAGSTCGWMFVDRSRNGLRRWCEMETCGTSAKSRRRAARQRSAE